MADGHHLPDLPALLLRCQRRRRRRPGRWVAPAVGPLGSPPETPAEATTNSLPGCDCSRAGLAVSGPSGRPPRSRRELFTQQAPQPAAEPCRAATAGDVLGMAGDVLGMAGDVPGDGAGHGRGTVLGTAKWRRTSTPFRADGPTALVKLDYV